MSLSSIDIAWQSNYEFFEYFDRITEQKFIELLMAELKTAVTFPVWYRKTNNLSKQRRSLLGIQTHWVTIAHHFKADGKFSNSSLSPENISDWEESAWVTEEHTDNCLSCISIMQCWLWRELTERNICFKMKPTESLALALFMILPTALFCTGKRLSFSNPGFRVQ